jgi:hypothetical protein
MGGVDRFDQLKKFYGTNKRSCKYYMRLVHYFINLCVVNGWLLYRRHCSQTGGSKPVTLLDFTGSVAQVDSG